MDEKLKAISRAFLKTLISFPNSRLSNGQSTETFDKRRDQAFHTTHCKCTLITSNMEVRKFWNFLSCDRIIWLLTKFLITKDMSTRKKQLKHWFPFLKKPSHFLPFLQCVLIFIFQTFSRIQNSVAGRFILTLNEALFHKHYNF